MDEKFFTLKKGDLLPENDRVYRLVHVNFRDKKNNKIPAEMDKVDVLVKKLRVKNQN